MNQKAATKKNANSPCKKHQPKLKRKWGPRWSTRTRDSTSRQLADACDGLAATGETAKPLQDDSSCPLEDDDDCVIVGVEEANRFAANDDKTGRHTRKEGGTRTSLVWEAWRSGMCSREGMLYLQLLLDPFRTVRQVWFEPPYPQSPTPLHACILYRCPFKIQPPPTWPHPLNFCRPPHSYPLYYL